jgi:ribonuclease HII
MSEDNKEMTPEERQRLMDFILNHQAQFAVNQQKSDGRIDRLEGVMKLVVRAGLRERKETREKINALIASQMHTDEALARVQMRTDEALARMADAQAHSDARLDALIDIVRNERNGKS